MRATLLYFSLNFLILLLNFISLNRHLLLSFYRHLLLSFYRSFLLSFYRSFLLNLYRSFLVNFCINFLNFWLLLFFHYLNNLLFIGSLFYLHYRTGINNCSCLIILRRRKRLCFKITRIMLW